MKDRSDTGFSERAGGEWWDEERTGRIDVRSSKPID